MPFVYKAFKIPALLFIRFFCCVDQEAGYVKAIIKTFLKFGNFKAKK